MKNKPRIAAVFASAVFRTVFYAVFGVIIISGLILFVVYRNNINDDMLSRITGIFSSSPRSAGNNLDIPLDKNPKNQYAVYNKRLAVLSPERLALYNKSGEESFSTAVNRDNAVLIAGTDKVIVFERGAAFCGVYSQNSQEMNFNSNVIISAVITKKDCYAIATERDRYKGAVAVYMKNKLVFEWFSSETGYISGIGLSPDASRLVVATAKQENNVPVGTIIFFDTSKETPVFKEEISDTLICSAGITANGNIRAVCDDGVRFYDTEGKLLTFYPFEDKILMGVSETEDICSMLLSGSIVLLDENGEAVISLPVSNVTSLSSSGEYTALISSGIVSLYNGKGELVYSKYDLYGINRAIAISDGSIMLIGNETAYWAS